MPNKASIGINSKVSNDISSDFINVILNLNCFVLQHKSSENSAISTF